MKKTPLRKVRRKPRPGRVKGKAMEELRRACFERDGYRCQGVVRVNVSRWKGVNLIIPFFYDMPCGKSVTWESGHMAHIRAKRRHGDSLENVRTLCADCHRREHQWGKSGVKPCPSKRVANAEERDE